MGIIKSRAIEDNDLSLIQKWRNSDNVMPNCRQYRPLSTTDMENWYDGLTKDKDYNLTNDIFLLLLQGAPIGAGGLTRIDWRSRKAEVSFYVAETKNCTKKIISEALLFVVDYGIKTLNMRKVYFPVYSFNPYLPIYEKVMEREYIAKSEYFYEGKYYDRIVLVKYGHI